MAIVERARAAEMKKKNVLTNHVRLCATVVRRPSLCSGSLSNDIFHLPGYNVSRQNASVLAVEHSGQDGGTEERKGKSLLRPKCDDSARCT